MFLAGFALATGLLGQGSKTTTGAAALQGTWDITSLNGEALPAGAGALRVTFAGDTYQQAERGEVTERGTIKVDGSKKPMTIDFTIIEGADAGKTQLGIIEVSGDTIRACLDHPGAGRRPTDFSVKEGVIMFVGKKSKP